MKKDCRGCVNFRQHERAGYCSWRNVYLKLSVNPDDGSRYFNICKDFEYKNLGDSYERYNRNKDRGSSDKMGRPGVSRISYRQHYLQALGKFDFKPADR